MKDERLEQVLRELFEKEQHEVSDRYPTETDECLPLSRLVMSRRDSWSAEEQEHMRHCRSFCQRMIAIGWRDECPPIMELIAYAAYPEGQCLQAAFDFHLENDLCRWCTAITKSALVASAPLRVAAALIRLDPTNVAEFATEAGTGSQPDTELIFERQQTLDGRLKWTTYETPDHELKLDVETPDQTDDGRRVMARFQGEAITEEIELPQALQWNGYLCRSEYSIGMTRDVVRKFGTELHVTVWPQERS